MTDKELKSAFVQKLKGMTIPPFLDEVDGRIRQYIEYVRDLSEGDRDRCNVDQVAMCCKFLRCANIYGFDQKHVKRYIKMAEGLKLDSLDGKRTYPMTPAQVFIVAGLHAFTKQVHLTLFGKDVTEERKLVQDGILFVARKFGKTQLDAWESIDDFLFGDNDAETHIVSNSLDQSKIAYRAIVDMLKQLDPDGTQIRFTQSEITWRDGKRRAIYPHTAGAKAKDGAKASLVIADEYGSAKYVKDSCDMSKALEVYLSSMGTRKNHLSIISTTAGRVVEGPFETLLKAYQEALYKELDATLTDTFDTDRQFLYSCHPDAWEYSEEYYQTENLWHKCNPHCGITIQPTFYREEWAKTKGNPEHLKEVVTKLFNQFVSDSSRPWIQAEDIRRLQCKHTIRQLNKDWLCWVGCDFSKGDDLCTLSYNCYNPKTKQYFFDCDAWIAEEQMTKHSNCVLYREWYNGGWLHVSPSSIIDEADVLAKLDEVSRHVRIIAIGYDPYDSLRYVNMFQTWIASKLTKSGMMGNALDAAIKNALQPVSQTWGSFNSSVQVMWDLVKWPEQRVYVSPNPIIPFCFGSCVLDEDKMGNVKPIQRSRTQKIDVAIGLLEGVIMQSKVRS